MTSPTALPPLSELTASGELVSTFRSMATNVTVRIRNGRAAQPGCLDRVIAVFRDVETQCTRFEPTSALMRANAAGADWCIVPLRCYAAIRAAVGAYRMTGGRFDPRVLRALEAIGYDRSWPLPAMPQPVSAPRPPVPVRGSWLAEFDDDRLAVRIGQLPIDLGGIGKGLALRWAAAEVISECPDFLLQAGGDCYLAGDGPTGDGWQVAVEDPRGSSTPVAVLTLRDQACATSSTEVRHWTSGGREVHHLIDPATGEPAESGLLSVTVVAPDPAIAEVWSKVLFLGGREHIAAMAEGQELAAAWVADNGDLRTSSYLDPSVIWRAA
jgi:thiamine biosynthesis lipoprotein